MSWSETFNIPKYTYNDLKSPDALRLLKLRPSGSPKNDVEIELFEVEHDHSTPYDAVSWCWGTEDWDKSIRIIEDEQVFSFPISPNLESALRAFRTDGLPRTLWVDAICIDQANSEEKNHQVPMMAHIYGQAEKVCIWLGDEDKDEKEGSKRALRFIKEEVLRIWEFDKLCESDNATDGWAALLRLMNRAWFSRRWVIQEIALANEAELQCGEDRIRWQDFADAVSLFAEVETATHRISEVMKRNQAFDHIPNFFGHVPALGATLLVDAVSNLFRRTRDGNREHLMSLENLVSSLSVFETTQPRDIIYALLAIAKDTTPRAANEKESFWISSSRMRPVKEWGKRNIAAQAYYVDYTRPFLDICKDFTIFSIRNSEPSRALDIICRPWVPRVGREQSFETIEKLPSWMPDINGAPFRRIDIGVDKMRRKNADPLVGMPDLGQRNYTAAGSRHVSKALRFEKRRGTYSMFVEGFVLDKVNIIEEASRLGNIGSRWLRLGGWHDTRDDPPDEFWRTLVADRGPNRRNAPTYYPRACKEAFNKGYGGDTLNTTELIDHGRCSIVAEFLRRVQSVIWNRRLIRTENGRLGLAHDGVRRGDLVCILYGCSVPIVLRKVAKTDEQLQSEQDEDELIHQQKKEEAVLKIQEFWRKMRQKRATKISIWQRLWSHIRHIVPALIGIFLVLENFSWKILCVFAILLLVFPELLLAKVWFRLVRAWRIRFPRMPKKPNGSRNRECYKLIGPCYVHGMMNGEAITYQNDFHVRPEIFELR